MDTVFSDLTRLLEQLTWVEALDILVVALMFYALLVIVRGTQAVNLLRGVIVLVILVVVFSGLFQLRAVSWLLRATLPALLLAIPVIFQPEIRRALTSLGRAGSWITFRGRHEQVMAVIQCIVRASERLSKIRYGGLIVIEREIGLQEYVDTGVNLNANISAELLVQIFHKDTPLHDGAAVLRGEQIVAAACVMPLSTNTKVEERRYGLRHRAAIGITESSDAVAVIISEETGSISVAYNGRMIRKITHARLSNILAAFYQPRTARTRSWIRRILGIKTKEYGE
ncbi:MAG: diadenylate cyclase CdaA [Anaerolineales bacterium]|nr:diadenylate cyclase CdaA [Anaerolineales bacterium]